MIEETLARNWVLSIDFAKEIIDKIINLLDFFLERSQLPFGRDGVHVFKEEIGLCLFAIFPIFSQFHDIALNFRFFIFGWFLACLLDGFDGWTVLHNNVKIALTGMVDHGH